MSTARAKVIVLGKTGAPRRVADFLSNRPGFDVDSKSVRSAADITDDADFYILPFGSKVARLATWRFITNRASVLERMRFVYGDDNDDNDDNEEFDALKDEGVEDFQLIPIPSSGRIHGSSAKILKRSLDRTQRSTPLPQPKYAVLFERAVGLMKRPFGRKARVFLSYRREDTVDMTDRIDERLKIALGRGHVFRDMHSIDGGEDFRQRIQRGIEECDVFLAIIGEDWLAETSTGRGRLDDPKDTLRREVQIALSSERDLKVVPVLVRDAAMPNSDKLPRSLWRLCDLNAMHVRGGQDFDRDMDRLIELVRADTGTLARH